jgi:hypothetical protein
MALNSPKHKAARKSAVEKSLGLTDTSQAKETLGGGRQMTPSEMGHTPIPAEAPTEAPTGTRVNLSRGLSSGPLYDYSDFEIPEAMKMTFRAEDPDTGDYDTGDYDTGDYDTGDYDTGDYDTGEPDTGIDPMKYMAEKYKRLSDALEFYDPDEDEDKALGPSTMPQDTANDYSEYQQKQIYGRKGDAGEAAYGDLDNRLNNPEDSGTISSSSHPDWRGTGYTMYEIVGEDMTRYFLESPEDATAFNITGHPDAGRE